MRPAIVVAMIVLSFFQGIQPPRDAPKPHTGTAGIRGRVTDKATGAPLPDYIVHLSGVRAEVTRTDRYGRYEFLQLPPGSYFVDVDLPDYRATYLRQRFGDSRASLFRRPGAKPVVLQAGEVRDDIDVPLLRSLAISGRVVDESGGPLANVTMVVEDLETGNEAQLYSRTPPTTDDLGAFRAFGLPSGTYRVCAVPSYGTAAREPTRTVLIRTCYPSAIVDAEAQPVALRSSDVGGVEIRVQRSRTFTISGFVVNAAGEPVERAEVSIVPPERSGARMSGYSLVQSGPGGAFVAYGVVPGEYMLRAETGRPASSSTPDFRERQMGFAPVRVGSDLEGVNITVAPAVTVRGHVTFEEGLPDLRRAMPMTVSVRTDLPLSRAFITGPTPTAAVKEDLTFELRGLFGPQVLRLNSQSNWTIKAVRYKGNDVTDTPTEFKPVTDPGGLEILLTSRAPVLWGHVLDDSGNVVPQTRVMLFATDPRFWRLGVSTTVTMFTLDDGTYRTGRIRPGEYLLIALSADERLPLLFDAEGFELLAKVAEKIVLVEGDERLLDIRAVKLPR